MQFPVKTLALVLFASGISGAFAKTLTEKQARDAATRIDSLLAEDLKDANLKLNGRIDEETFLRRSYLSIIGRIPTEAESRSFLGNTSSTKRASLIDQLVASPGFDSHLFNWTADLLRVQTRQEQFGLGWHVWLRQSLSEDKPWDTIVREMLSSTGHASKDPAVGYYLRDRNMQLDNFSNTMQVFLGRQIGCAQCHDHPFEDWSRFEYYQMAAFGGGTTYFSKDARETVTRVIQEVNKDSGENPKNRRNNRNKAREKNRGFAKLLNPLFKDFNKNAIFDNPAQSLRLPEDYQYSNAEPKSEVPAETLFGESLENVPADERRDSFAKWVTSPENPYFTKVIANRLWARTFGHGLLDPVDDWNEDSKPAHPEVLAFLETTMKAVDYDLRQFSRVLFHTNLFQRECDTTEPEPGVAHLVRGPALQRMTAEQLYDSMIVLTRGEINDSPLAANSNKWDEYTKSVEKLLNAETHDLLILAETTSQAETAFRESQNKLRALQRKIADATSQNERKQIYEAITDARETMLKYRAQSNPLGSMNMAMMEMGGRGKNRDNSTARASEMPAPFNPGTLVREFGGSDRASPSSGNTIPTVPQALALLNDPTTDIVGDKKRSSFAKSLYSLKSPEERLDLIFLCLYSRQPSKEEKENFLPLAQDKTSLRDLTRAMLTSNRFIFIQ